jgi:hypothetical protein
MAATVEVIIQGLAICYQKRVDGKKVWRVLFPFDATCHRIKFDASTQQGGNIELAGARRRINITTEPRRNKTDSTSRFKRTVFNLTSGDTHAQLSAKDGWEEKGVLLTMENIRLDLDRPLRIRPKKGGKPLELTLTDKDGNKIKTLGETAYSIRGKFRLKDRGRVIVKEGSETIFATAPDEDCILTFDNDCKDETAVQSDMEMFYALVGNPDKPDEQFLVESKEKTTALAAAKNSVAPPISERDEGIPATTGDEELRSEGDKPCLSAQVTKTDRLP